MRRILREPLLHFLLLGAAIFVIHSGLSTGPAEPPGQIVITRGRIEALATVFTRTWQRPPTAGELDGLVRDAVRDEVCDREARAMGLDREDTVIRRRLRQKLEFVATDLAAVGEPTDAQLRAYLATHADAFRAEPRFSFEQVYLRPGRDAAAALAQLSNAETGADPAAMGDAAPLEQRYEDVSAGEVARLFGQSFADGLASLPAGSWQGPITSGYGLHLVLVKDHRPGGLPDLESVRSAVLREWVNAQRLAAIEQFHANLLSRYSVRIERPATGEVTGQLAKR